MGSHSSNLTQTASDGILKKKKSELALQKINEEVTKVSYRECYPMAQQEKTMFNKETVQPKMIIVTFKVLMHPCIEAFEAPVSLKL